jgi:hypothetical protein
MTSFMNPMVDFVHVYLRKEDMDVDLDVQGAGSYYPKGTYLDVNPVSADGKTLSGTIHHQGTETKVEIEWIKVFGNAFSDAVREKTGKGAEEKIRHPKSVIADLLKNEFVRYSIHWMCEGPPGVIAIQIADAMAMSAAYRSV